MREIEHIHEYYRCEGSAFTFACVFFMFLIIFNTLIYLLYLFLNYILYLINFRNRELL